MAELEEIEKQYHSIGEVAKMLDVKPSLIRFWETEFEQLHPRKNRKGNRTYAKKDIELLKGIYYLVKVRKFTLKGAKDKLKKGSTEVETNARIRESLLKIRDFLAELKNAL